MAFDWQVALGTALVGVGEKTGQMYDDYKGEQLAIRQEDRRYQTEMRKEQEKYRLAQQREAAAKKLREENLPDWIDPNSPDATRYIEGGTLPNQTVDEKISDTRKITEAATTDTEAAWEQWQMDNPQVAKDSPQWHAAAAQYGIVTGGMDPAKAAIAAADQDINTKMYIYERMIEELDIDPNGKEARQYWKSIFNIQSQKTGMKPPTASDWSTLQKNAETHAKDNEDSITKEDIAQKKVEVFEATGEEPSDAQAIKEIKKDMAADYFKRGVQNWSTQMGGSDQDGGGEAIPFSVRQNGAVAAGLAINLPEPQARKEIEKIKAEDPERGAQVEQMYEKALKQHQGALQGMGQSASAMAGEMGMTIPRDPQSDVSRKARRKQKRDEILRRNEPDAELKRLEEQSQMNFGNMGALSGGF